jgi:DnaK suppressor protein
MTATADPPSTGQVAAQLRQRHLDTTQQLREATAAARMLHGDHGPQDLADAGNVVTESAESALVVAALREQLARLEGALQRVEEGTFGICERCRKRIPPQRLELMPWATHCVPCLDGTRRQPRQS